MVKWQVRGQGWREESHGGNEILMLMSREISMAFGGPEVHLGGLECNRHYCSCIILAFCNLLWIKHSAGAVSLHARNGSCIIWIKD